MAGNDAQADDKKNTWHDAADRIAEHLGDQFQEVHFAGSPNSRMCVESGTSLIRGGDAPPLPHRPLRLQHEPGKDPIRRRTARPQRMGSVRSTGGVALSLATPPTQSRPPCRKQRLLD